MRHRLSNREMAKDKKRDLVRDKESDMDMIRDIERDLARDNSSFKSRNSVNGENSNMVVEADLK